jgi:hypothetical protein
MLLSHRLADFAANPQVGGTVLSSLGLEAGQTFPSGTQAGDISIFGMYVVFGRPQAITPSAGWTLISGRTYSSVRVALYAKVLSSTDISRGTTGFTFDSAFSLWNITIRGTNPFSSFTSRGLATQGTTGGSKPALTMSNTTENPGIIVSHFFTDAVTDPGDYTITNASATVLQYASGGRAQGQTHDIAVELTTSADSTTARTSSSFNAIGDNRNYTETIVCLNGIE